MGVGVPCPVTTDHELRTPSSFKVVPDVLCHAYHPSSCSGDSEYSVVYAPAEGPVAVLGHMQAHLTVTQRPSRRQTSSCRTSPEV